jgi:hypothetical protein
VDLPLTLCAVEAKRLAQERKIVLFAQRLKEAEPKL